MTHQRGDDLDDEVVGHLAHTLTCLLDGVSSDHLMSRFTSCNGQDTGKRAGWKKNNRRCS